MQKIRSTSNFLVGSYVRARNLPRSTVKQIEDTIKTGKSNFDVLFISSKTWLYKLILVSLTAFILLYASIFMYITFYFAFIPVVAHEAPLHLGFEPCFEKPEKCGFINATVPLNRLSGSGIRGAISHSNAPILMSGQAYTVVVGINMPESPRNRDLGMFMSCLQIHSVNRKPPKQDEIIRSACKSSMIQYRSSLLRTIETLALSLFYMTGHLVEKQKVYIEFFDDFTETPLKPATRVDFELQSRFAEVYDARLIIHAKFVGLRYFMYYYPVTSAIVGTLFNFHILSLVVLLSWLRFFAPSKYTDDPYDYGMDDDDLQKPFGTEDTNTEEDANCTKDDFRRRTSSDLEVIANENTCQVDAEEDKFSQEIKKEDFENENKKNM